MICALEHSEEGMTSNNLTKIIMKAVQALTTMSKEVAKKMIVFGAGEFLDSLQLPKLHPTTSIHNSDVRVICFALVRTNCCHNLELAHLSAHIFIKHQTEEYLCIIELSIGYPKFW